MIKWQALESQEKLEEIISLSSDKPQIIFKHSTTCPISSMAKNRLEGTWAIDDEPYYLDLLKYRHISDAIADRLSVVHESPQVIIVKDGTSIFNASHLDIDFNDIKEVLVN